MIMKTSILKNVLFIGIATLLMSFDIPTGWFKTGNKPQSYEMGIDKGAGQNSKNAATIKSIDKKIDGFGTLMQECLPDKYIGKRVRMTAMLKTKEVSDWVGLWLRIDTKTPVKAFAFDNMHVGEKDRSLKGTIEWKKYEIVIDVPTNAANIAFGVLLSGTGQVWFDNLNFEIVDFTIPTTGIEMETLTSKNHSNQKEPINLDFEK